MRIVFVAPSADLNTSASPTGLFKEAIQIAESVSPDLRIRTDLISGENTAILTALTAEAALIVAPQDDPAAPGPTCSFARVGTPRESSAAAALPVVVGLDGSAYSESALAIAFKEAEAAEHRTGRRARRAARGRAASRRRIRALAPALDAADVATVGLGHALPWRRDPSDRVRRPLGCHS